MKRGGAARMLSANGAGTPESIEPIYFERRQPDDVCGKIRTMSFLHYMSRKSIPMSARKSFQGLALSLIILIIGSLIISAAAMAQTKPLQTLRIVGGIATGNRFARIERPFWTTELAKLSGGKFSADIVPFDRAGVSGQDMLRMMQLGVIPFGTALVSHMAGEAPEFNAPDLAGLNPDIASLKIAVTAFRPYLEKTLRDRYGVELLSVYVYPAQVIFCKRPITKLTDLSGRRIRVSSATAADFIQALGGTPVLTEFSEIMTNMASGNTECAVTSAMSGNTLGLHTITSHLYNLPVSWGLSVLAANVESWRRVDPELRTLLLRELPKLEAAIWSEAARDTVEGIACNSGIGECTNGRKGKMTVLQLTHDDDQRRQQIFRQRVLPQWVQRCGVSCAKTWNQTVKSVVGIDATGSN